MNKFVVYLIVLSSTLSCAVNSAPMFRSGRDWLDSLREQLETSSDILERILARMHNRHAGINPMAYRYRSDVSSNDRRTLMNNRNRWGQAHSDDRESMDRRFDFKRNGYETRNENGRLPIEQELEEQLSEMSDSIAPLELDHENY